MHQGMGSDVFTGASYFLGYYGTKLRGIKTSNWADTSGTIFMMESWRNFGFTHCWGNNIHWSGGPFASKAGTLNINDARKFWQEKHQDRANLVFCDGHVESLPLSATTGTGAKVSDPDFSPRTGLGMWTSAQGD